MKNVRAIGLHSLTLLPHYQQVALAQAYQSIYGAPPWNEQWKCANPGCEASWGINQKHKVEELEFRHCGLPIIQYWPEVEMLKEFVLISSKPNFCASLAYDYNDIVGFCWAYQFESTEEVEKEMNFPGLGNLLSVIDGPMAYLADLAVKPEYRNQGVAKMITKTRADIMLNLGIESVFTRTKSGTSPSVTDIWYDKINIPIIAHYNDLRQRVIRAAKLSDITW